MDHAVIVGMVAIAVVGCVAAVFGFLVRVLSIIASGYDH